VDGCVCSAATILRTGRPRSCRSAKVHYAARWTAGVWSASGVAAGSILWTGQPKSTDSAPQINKCEGGTCLEAIAREAGR
jgi:hypothetical protein